ncbi:hypothetical protein F2Q68_00024877 [Brassica cretica]|uniref:Uncharacterized protein n=1 Tax=Brassica cretica TaxID=69181 RepID=A0A8S9I7Z4_BRACR|nr:hypothetical protein F2Q68_00024877 [Brassica cretica]
MSSTPGGPTPKAGERHPSSTTTDGSSEVGKSSQRNPGSARPPTNAAIDSMLSTAKNASSTTPSTARTIHPVEPTVSAAPPAQTTTYSKEPSNTDTGNMPNADLATMLLTLLEKDRPSAHSRVGYHRTSPTKAHVKRRTSAAHARNISLGRIACTDRRL